MLIRSQDGKIIIPIESIEKIEIRKFEEPLQALCCEAGEERYIFVNNIRFASYLNERSAIDVLDDICSTYQYQRSIGGTGAQYVYEMPRNREDS